MCLSAKLEETEQERDAAEAKARAWDALVEMRGELGWHTDMQKWWVSVPTGINEHGLVVQSYSSGPDPVVAVGDAHARWREIGRPNVAPRSDDEDACARRYLDNWKLAEAEEIKARRAKEAADV